MADIQRDPRAAMKKYGGDEEVVQFILAFMRLLGQQMESGEEKQGVEMKDGEKAPRGSEKERRVEGGVKQRQVDPQQIQRWMSDPTIRVSPFHPFYLSPPRCSPTDVVLLSPSV